MKTFLPTLLFFFSLSLDGQIFEVSKTREANFLSQITPLPDEGGYLAFGGYGALQQIDRHGEVVWEYGILDAFPSFTSLVSPNYLRLPDGRIFGATGNFECDICIGSGIFMLAPNGNQLWAKELNDSFLSGCSAPVFSFLSKDNHIIGIGRDSIWNIDLDGNVFSRKKHQLPINWNNFEQWANSEFIYHLFDGKLFAFNEEGEIKDSLAVPANWVKGLAANDSLSYIIFDNRVKLMKNFEFVGNDYVNSNIRFSHAFFKNERLYLLGTQGDEILIGSIDKDLGDPQFITWGNKYLKAYGFSGLDSVLFVAGREGTDTQHNTSFFKTFDDGLNYLPLKYDAEVTEASADSAYGYIQTIFPDPFDSTVTYLQATWFIKNLKTRVRNNGIDTIERFTLNSEGPYQFGCYEGPTFKSRDFVFDLPPGADTTIVWGDRMEQLYFPTSNLPNETSFCFWVTSPNNLLDVDNSNDKKCGTISIRNVTSVKSPFQSDALTLYPNPTSGLLNLELDDTQFREGEIQIFNPFGKLVFAQPYQSSGANSLNVSDLPSGVYVLHLKFAERQMVQQFVKN